jgi:hypothetical protein
MGGVSISEEIRASTAAHRDLGPGYDSAVAEGLVDRIGEEIDKRIDARLFARTQPVAQPQRPPTPGRLGFAPVMLALGSMGLGIGATVAVLQPGNYNGSSPVISGTQAFLTALIWIIIAVVNVAYSRRR